MSFRGTVSGFAAISAQLNATEERILAGIERGVARAMLGGQSIVRGNASGRPGPRAPTGDFRRSIVGDHARAGSIILGQIGTNAPQARRLEYGFFGKDSLDRVYNQQPYPYLQPSVPGVTQLLISEVNAGIRAAL